MRRESTRCETSPQAKELAIEDLRETAALKVTLPWSLQAVKQAEQILGRDFWPYGVQPNLKALETMARYASGEDNHDHLIDRALILPSAMYRQ